MRRERIRDIGRFEITDTPTRQPLDPRYVYTMTNEDAANSIYYGGRLWEGHNQAAGDLTGNGWTAITAGSEVRISGVNEVTLVCADGDTADISFDIGAEGVDVTGSADGVNAMYQDGMLNADFDVTLEVGSPGTELEFAL